MILKETGVASVGRAEHSIVSSCVAQQTGFPKILLAIFCLYARKECYQSNNIGKCGLDAFFVVSFAVPVWSMVSAFISG